MGSIKFHTQSDPIRQRLLDTPLAGPTLTSDPVAIAQEMGCHHHALLGTNAPPMPSTNAAPTSNPFAIQSNMDPRAAAAFSSQTHRDGYWSPSEIADNVGQTFGREMIPLHYRAEQSSHQANLGLLLALQGASQSDIVNLLGRDNPGSAALAQAITALAGALQAQPQDFNRILGAAQQVHWNMIGHVATNSQERKLGQQLFQQAYGVSRPGSGGTYRGQGEVGSTVERYAPGATNPRQGEFVTKDPSQAGLAALRAAQSQVGVREATGNNDGVPSQRFAGGRKEPWCADFVTWTFQQAGQPLPGNQRALAGVQYMEDQMKRAGKFHTGTPQPGDVIFFKNRGASDAGSGRHVGIVEKVENGMVYTIEGNSGNAVRRRSYSLDNPRISGYGRQ